jgi:DNA repair exonuclease SbcCD ATPase subunit
LLQSKLEEFRTKRQSLEIHENMLLHGEAVLLKLNTMQEVDKQRTDLQQGRQQAIRRQNEENELLGKTFAQYQDLLSQIETAEAELSMHRSYIQGQDGLMLQERALMLKGRRQMLHSALSLWKRISTGYETIEEKSRKVTALRLHIQHLENGVHELESEAGKAHRLCKEKEYTYLLSKGQDIIQLRADLREGVSCSVCGATHHPYHSDTILDQSKLIGQMKTDYELLASEANAKQQQLMEMQTELATAKGELKAEEEALNTIRIRQNEDVQEWKLYAQLDSTFAECSESTDLNARTSLLLQFIENVSRNAELAEKELETFTFHQSSIAKISEELQQLEQKKNEINVRLNELNTGCQVLSREVERISLQLENANKQFTRIYENMQLAVTIKDWFSIWQRSPEQLYEQIQKLINDWFHIEKEIKTRQAVLDVENTKLADMKALLQSLNRSSSITKKQAEDLEERKAENLKAYQQMIPEKDAKTLHQNYLQKAQIARDDFEKERSQMDNIRHESDIMQGRHDYYLNHIDRLEGERRELNERLDLWMHAFNLQHPPVQSGELDEAFADGKNWSEIRSKLKQITTDILLSQTKVDDLNSRIIALETEDGICNISLPDI